MIGLGLGLDCFPIGGSPPPSFADFDEINTNFWFSLNPNASRVSAVSFGSGVSQITGVNSGAARNATQPTGAFQPPYNATGLNGFPCVFGSLAGYRELSIPIVDISGCAVLAVVELPTSYVNDYECFGVGNNILGLSSSLFSGRILNSFSGLPQDGIGINDIESGCLSSAVNTGVAFWFVSEGAYRTSWKGGVETGSTETIGASFETWVLSWFPSTIKLGEFVILSANDSTPANITRSINILKSRWGIA